MKLIFVIVLCLSLYTGTTQSLESRIPVTAECVISFNGKTLTDKIGMKNINKSVAFLDFTQQIIFKGNSLQKVSAMGIDLKKPLYFFFNDDDSISYYVFLYEIEKPKSFGKYINEKTEVGEKVKTALYDVLFYKNEKEFLAWNDQYAMYVILDHYTDKNATYSQYEYELEMADGLETYEVVDDAPVVAGEEVVETIETEETQEVYEARRKAEEEARAKARAEKVAARRNVFKSVLDSYFSKEVRAKSILQEAHYMANKNKTADINLWMNLENTQGISPFLYGYEYGYDYGPYRMFSSMMSQYLGGKISSNLFFNNDKVSWETNFDYNNELADLFKQIYSTKLPKRYLKYIDPNALGVVSTSINSTKLWEAYPKFYATILKSFERRGESYNEEVEVITDFFSIMLDETALGDLVTGNGIFVLKDIIPTTVEYTSYEYNEDYTKHEKVTKTREDVMPEFLAMFGTRNQSFMEKLLRLGCKHEILYMSDNTNSEQYYYTNGESRDFPFKLYITFKEDIAFISTNLNEINRIIEGKVKYSLDKKTENKMAKNTGFGMLNIEQLLSRIPSDNLSVKEKALLVYAQKNSETVEYFSNFEGERSNINFELKSPSNYKNSALYIWRFIDEMYKIDTGH